MFENARTQAISRNSDTEKEIIFFKLGISSIKYELLVMKAAINIETCLSIIIRYIYREREREQMKMKTRALPIASAQDILIDQDRRSTFFCVTLCLV